MNESLIQENKKKLLAEKERIVSILQKAGTKEGLGEFPGDYKPSFPDIGNKDDENAAEVTQFETSLALTKNLEEKLKKVKAALARIEAGTYGKDAEGKDIPEDRLRVVPEAES